jgi:hypothetical protein
MMDAYQLSPCQVAKEPFQGIATSRSPIFRKAMHVIFDWWEPKDNFPAFIRPIRPEHFDRRLALQRGCFTFHVPIGTFSLQRKTIPYALS